MPNNQEFLTALFGDDAPWTHVTDFVHDPDHIPPTRELIAWRGDFFSRYHFQPISNQYFTISHFYADSNQARRRKSLYRHTRVVVLDDVKEKLSVEQAQRLPPPSWIMETSPGSEQWGYILDQPCTERHRVENLLDGLVANGLAPNGKDPGMKGVTRYVRLPDGYNLKAKKFIDGKPFKVRLAEWNPFNVVTLEQLAQPFGVNLDALRREQRVDGAAQIDDHPLLNIPDIIHIKEVRSDGRFDITCPWVDEHTHHLDSGTAIFTNADGTIGFKCHHGSCQARTGRQLLEHIEANAPGFGLAFSAWKTLFAFAAVSGVHAQASVPLPTAPPSAGSPPALALVSESNSDILAREIGNLRRNPPYTAEAREQAEKILKVSDSLPAIEKQHWHEEVRAHMQWSKTDFTRIIKSLRETWYDVSGEVNFFDETIFVGELNQFYDAKKNIFYSPEAYQNTYSHLSADARKDALQGGLVIKVDRIDYAPKQPPIFTQGFVKYGNTWTDSGERHGVMGEIKPYLDHFAVLGWTSHRHHLMQFMAHTLRHPEIKINHMLILGSQEGSGKDFILAPMIRALGSNSRTIGGDELLSNNQDFALGVKHIHINEVELGDHNDARTVANRLKPYTAAPPDTLRVNPKNVKPFSIRNIVNVTLGTNSPVPINFRSPTRRAYAIWSDFTIRDEEENPMPEWIDYWGKMWEWMNNGGADAVIYFLRNQMDLSTFNPGQSPPITDYLREIRAASMSPMQLMVQGFVHNKVAAFGSDLLTAKEMSDVLRMAPLLRPDLITVRDVEAFNHVRVGMLMKEMGYPQRRASDGKTHALVYVLRNRKLYANMEAAELLSSYHTQTEAARKTTGSSLRVVQ